MLVGRKTEIRRLEKIYKSAEAEFVVLHGRRRIGKTFLIRQFFRNKPCQFFQCTGLKKGLLKKQLAHFAESLSETFTHNVPVKSPQTWDEALKMLTQLVETSAKKFKTVIFLDELPWMATKRSGLLEALDYYWNRFWSANPNIILVVCGSSASWLIKNIIYNQGGLHNRCTAEIQLKPFNLLETQAYFLSKQIKLNKSHLLELYMALGGVPYYLNYVQAGLSAPENIQNIFFAENAPLKDEFNKLFNSLFTEANIYIELIELIAKKKEGINRSTLEALSKFSRGGGRLTERLSQLIHTNFIESYLPWDKTRGEYYKVIDEFCLFYIYWLSEKSNRKFTDDYWLKQSQKPIYHVWSGYAFEAICHKHIQQVINKLNIKTVENVASWRLVTRKPKENGAQIDLLIDRSDDAITLCEIKYTNRPFVLDKASAENLQKKIAIFKQATGTRKQIFIALISANGIKPTIYSEEILSDVVTLHDLF